MNKYMQKYRQMPAPIKASLWFLMCSFFQKGLSTITTPIFTRILTTEEYGQISVFNSWMSIIAPIVCLNLYSGVYSQGLVKFEEDRKRYSSSLQGLCFTLTAMWGMIYLSGRNFWNNLLSLTTMQGIAMLIMIWASSTFSFWSMNQRVDFKYKKLVLLTVAVSIVQPIVGITLILNSEDKVTARILGIAAVQLVFYFGTFITQMLQGKQFFSKRYWVYALKFNIPLLPHYLSIHLLSSSDRIMISKLVGNGQAGIYNLAHAVALIMTIFNTAMLQTIEPWIYRKLKENRTMDLAMVAYPTFIAVAIVNILLILFAPEIIAIFAPVEYQEAVWTIPGLALSVFFMFLYTFFATFEFYYEKTSYIASATVGGALLNIVLNYIFIKKFGYIVAGYTTLFSYIVFAVLHYYFCHRICKEFMGGVKPYNTKVILAISAGTLLIGLSILLVYPYPLARYGFIVLLLAGLGMFRKRIISTAKMIWATKKERG